MRRRTEMIREGKTNPLTDVVDVVDVGTRSEVPEFSLSLPNLNVMSHLRALRAA